MIIVPRESTTYVNATAQPSNVPPRALLEVAWPTVEAAYISRVHADGTVWPVRGAEPADLSGGLWSGYDYEAPFNQSVTYRAINAASPTYMQVQTMTLSATRSWLIHPGRPELSRAFTLSAEESKTLPAPREIVRVLGRPTAIAVISGPRYAPESTLAAYCATDGDRKALLALLADGSSLLLNPILTLGLDYSWLSVGDLEVARLARLASEPSRTIAMPYVVVSRPVGVTRPEITWARLTQENPIWRDVMPVYDRWTDVVTNIQTP